MSSEQRRLLGEQYMRQQPELRSLLKSRDHDLFSGSWAMLAYSFERGFEELWDAAYQKLTRYHFADPAFNALEAKH